MYVLGKRKINMSSLFSPFVFQLEKSHRGKFSPAQGVAVNKYFIMMYYVTVEDLTQARVLHLHS
jgi:hypothetical protein